MTTHNQHYVWRYYLEAWQCEDGLVRCSRGGRILPPTNPKNLMVERHYYKLPRITRLDVELLRAFIDRTGFKPLIETHRNLLNAFAHIAQVNDLIQQSDTVAVADKHITQAIAIEIEEKLQQGIEEDGKPILRALRQKQTEFINTYETAITFYHFIAQQYFRTKRIRDAIGRELSQMVPNHDFSHLKHIMCHIGAVNVGGSLFVNRNDFDLVFWESSDDVGFITGDQPVVNLLGSGDGTQTTELALYYPLSPNLSCLIVPKEFRLQSGHIPTECVEELNNLIAWKADFLVAKTDEALQYTLSKSSSARPEGRSILESIIENPI